MASAKMIDMSLDEIIRMNKRAQKATHRKGKSALKARALNSKKWSLAKHGLLKTIKAQTLFRRARRTAAIAARVSSDSAALVTPANAIVRTKLALAGTRRNRPVNRHLVLRERLHAVNRQIRQRRGVHGNGNVKIRLGVRGGRQQQQAQRQALQTQARPWNAARNAVGVKNATFGARNLTTGARENNRGVVRQQNSLRRSALGPSYNVGEVVRNRRVSRGSGDLATSPRYAHYLQQARALMRAQREAARFFGQSNSSNNGGRRGLRQNAPIFVDIPMRNGGLGFGGFNRKRSDGRKSKR